MKHLKIYPPRSCDFRVVSDKSEIKHEEVGLVLARGRTRKGVFASCLLLACGLVSVMGMTGCANAPTPAPIVGPDESSILIPEPTIVITTTPEPVPASQSTGPTSGLTPPAPRFTSSTEDFQALIDHECALSAGNDLVMILPYDRVD